MARFDLSDAEWQNIEPLLPNKPRGVARVADPVAGRRLFAIAGRGECPMGYSISCAPAHPGAICPSDMPLQHRLQPLQPLGQGRCLGQYLQCLIVPISEIHGLHRQLDHPGTSECRRG